MYRILVIIILFFIILENISLAAPTSVGQIQRSQEILEEEKRMTDKLTKEEKFLIKKIVVEGASLLSEDQIKEIILPFQDKWLSKTDIKEILYSINQAYRQNGYDKQPSSISYEIKEGSLEIEVKELAH